MNQTKSTLRTVKLTNSYHTSSPLSNEGFVYKTILNYVTILLICQRGVK